MKSFHFVFIIYILSISAVYSNEKITGQRQFWYNGLLNRTIEVQHYTDGIEVKGLHSRHGYSWFQRRSSTSYFDKYGNKLKWSRNKVIYYNQRRNSRLTFLPRYDRTQNRDCDYDPIYRDMGQHDYSDNQNHDYEDYIPNRSDRKNQRYSKQSKAREHDINRSQSVDNRRSNPSNNFEDQYANTTALEGTWKVKDLNKKVYIVETRDGIKARFSDELKWYVYLKDSTNSVYIGENEQKYFIKNGILIWTNANQTMTFYLTKVSDDLED